MYGFHRSLHSSTDLDLTLCGHGQSRHPYPLFDDRDGQMKAAIRCARERLEATGQALSDVSPYIARHTVSTQPVINGVHRTSKTRSLAMPLTT